MSINITNEDNMELMKRYEDNYFDLAIVDPPYGIDMAKQAGDKAGKQYGKQAAKNGNYKVKAWDKYEPNSKYFKELFRVSKNQIIWGANYYPQFLTKSMGWIVWDKKIAEDFSYSDGEIAYSSFNKALKFFRWRWAGMLQQDMKNKEIRIHPTQKPVKLYEWLLMNYAKQGDKILDTHLGSGSIAIACHNLGYELTACELDTEYYNNAIKRLKQHQAQQRLFV